MEVLEGLPPQAEVRFAHQPSWPLEYKIGQVAELLTDDGFMVYLAEGEQVGYLPGQVTESLGWSR
ncbi:hypothetical protein IAG25_15635 [Caballeronia sp. EK]|uniref:hypothetical protein n=1 Tax=Caballeronia sp. EK TaxID=2767469 RepID=UPI00165624C4|nr:hypothetical protein [Caballeronia sp. EK]MBC8638253.1 hypothetical protein [Caballeronia sp. EK]